MERSALMSKPKINKITSIYCKSYLKKTIQWWIQAPCPQIGKQQ